MQAKSSPDSKDSIDESESREEGSPRSKKNSQDITKDERLPFSRYVLFFSLVVVGLAADLITKSLVLGNYSPIDGMEPVWWIDGILGIQTSLNGGALFGIGQGGSFWFALLSIIAFLAILFWLFARKLARSFWLTLILGLVSAGILGNCYDRVGFGYDPAWEYPEVRGHVRDWIHFRWEGIKIFDPWPNFNIADSLLVCGAIMLFLFAIFGTDDGKVPATRSSSNDSSS